MEKQVGGTRPDWWSLGQKFGQVRVVQSSACFSNKCFCCPRGTNAWYFMLQIRTRLGIFFNLRHKSKVHMGCCRRNSTFSRRTLRAEQGRLREVLRIQRSWLMMKVVSSVIFVTQTGQKGATNEAWADSWCLTHVQLAGMSTSSQRAGRHLCSQWLMNSLGSIHDLSLY